MDCAGAEGQGVVLVLHGYSVHRNILLKRTRFLHQAGYTVMLFDFQGHGQSSGEFATFGYREYYNVVAAMKFLRERFPAEKIGIVATSMGAVSVFHKAMLSPLMLMCWRVRLRGLRGFLKVILINFWS